MKAARWCFNTSVERPCSAIRPYFESWAFASVKGITTGFMSQVNHVPGHNATIIKSVLRFLEPLHPFKAAFRKEKRLFMALIINTFRDFRVFRSDINCSS